MRVPFVLHPHGFLEDLQGAAAGRVLRQARRQITGRSAGLKIQLYWLCNPGLSHVKVQGIRHSWHVTFAVKMSVCHGAVRKGHSH